MGPGHLLGASAILARGLLQGGSGNASLHLHFERLLPDLCRHPRGTVWIELQTVTLPSSTAVRIVIAIGTAGLPKLLAQCSVFAVRGDPSRSVPRFRGARRSSNHTLASPQRHWCKLVPGTSTRRTKPAIAYQRPSQSEQDFRKKNAIAFNTLHAASHERGFPNRTLARLARQRPPRLEVLPMKHSR